MESLSEESKQPWLAAFAGRVDSLFDRRGVKHFPLRCAANKLTAMHNDQACPINDYLAICNELLFDVGMELREQSGGSLSLICFRPEEPDVPPPACAVLNRSNTFLRWLLRTHVCIARLKLQYKWMTAHSQLLLEELPENCRLRKLKVQFPFETTVQTDFATLLPRLRCLEELYCYVSPISDTLLASISALLRNTTCLTSLAFYACFENSQPPQIFIDALAVNRTLKSLELWANWNTDEPPGTLGEYVRSNGLLTNLMLFGEEMDREELQLEEALVCNSTLATLNIGRLCGGARTVHSLIRILAECTGLKKLTLGGLRHENVYIAGATLTRCVEALAGNEMLEELTLSYSIWHPTNWVAFFKLLPKNTHLKKLEVSNTYHRGYETYLPVLEALAETDSLGRVSFGCYTPRTVELGLMHFRAFSGIGIYGEPNAKVNALKRLPLLDHITSVTIGLFQPDQRLFYFAAVYISATTVLRKLSLLFTNPAEDVPSSCWTLLFESISSNSSIADLRICGSDNFSYTGQLARTVGLSRCITRVSYSKIRPEWEPTSFIVPLSESLSDNYNLLAVDLSSNKVSAEARRCWFCISLTL